MLVHLVSGKEPETIFVSLEDVPLVLSDLRKAFPQLREELKSPNWKIVYVGIEEQRPRRANPTIPGQIVEAARIGLSIGLEPAVKAGSAVIGATVAAQLVKQVQAWIKKMPNPFRKTRRKRSSRKTHKSYEKTGRRKRKS